MSAYQNKPSCDRRKISGFSLVEMMISITIGLLVMAGLIGVLASNSRNSKTNDRTAELQSNGRYALDHLRSELRHADYRGYTWAIPNVPSGVAITNECLETGAAANSFVTNISQGIWGANDTNPFAANCLGSGYLRGDVLVIRHVAGTALVSPTVLVNGEMYFRSTFTKGEMFEAGSAVAATGEPRNADGTAFGVPLADFLVQEYVYYIGRDDSNTSLPALRRLTLRGGTMVDELVVSGIEQMQVQYGRTTDDMNTQYYNANQISAGTNAQQDWEDVNTARVWLLARNTQTEAGYTNTNTYTMGDITYDPTDDGYRRQLFTTVVQLRNFHIN